MCSNWPVLTYQLNCKSSHQSQITVERKEKRRGDAN